MAQRVALKKPVALLAPPYLDAEWRKYLGLLEEAWKKSDLDTIVHLVLRRCVRLTQEHGFDPDVDWTEEDERGHGFIWSHPYILSNAWQLAQVIKTALRPEEAHFLLQQGKEAGWHF